MPKPALVRKIQDLPLTPGVYLYKNRFGEIIYVGKAARLRARVGQYFQKSRTRDTKTELLIQQIADLDIIETESEIDALFLEAELIKRYKPHYNLALRDDKSEIFVRIETQSSHPTVGFSHRPLDDGAQYFGPYSNGADIKAALKLLRRIFPYDISTNRGAKRVSLDYHLGLSPGLEEGKTDLQDYRRNLTRLKQYLRGGRHKLQGVIEKEMDEAAATFNYETAKTLRDQLRSLQALRHQIVFSQREFIDISKDQALSELAGLIGLSAAPRRIEGYDISHLHGTSNTASLVVFSNGLPDKAQYRKFRMQIGGNDDTAHIREVISRRFSPLNIQRWGKADLLLIDGGKAQLSACYQALTDCQITVKAVALAKRWETLIERDESGKFRTIRLDSYPHVKKLLARIRDEAHRFAVSYQSSISRRRQTESRLDSVPGVGPATRRQLIKAFGSLRGILSASESQISAVVGPRQAALIRQHLSAGEPLAPTLTK